MIQSQYRRFIAHLLRLGDDHSTLLVLRHLCLPTMMMPLLQDKDFTTSILYYSSKYLASHEDVEIVKMNRAVWKSILDSKMPYLKDVKESFSFSSTIEELEEFTQPPPDTSKLPSPTLFVLFLALTYTSISR